MKYETFECNISQQDMRASTSKNCSCLDSQYGNSKPWKELRFHPEKQDFNSVAWKTLCEIVDDAAHDGRKEFAPAYHMSREEWSQIITLPASIKKLKEVETLSLYGSGLTYLPPEIGEMTSLSRFTPYCSYRLHWYPYELRHCQNLAKSTVSTRALYGNFKYKPPFPSLSQLPSYLQPEKCSICKSPVEAGKFLSRWISLQVATDVLPLLVHSCSEDCLSSLPEAPREYFSGPHRGGLMLQEYFDQHAAILPTIKRVNERKNQPEALPRFMQDLKKGEKSPAELIADLGAKSGDQVIRYLLSECSEISTEALCSIGDDSFIPEMVKRLENGDYKVRTAAARGLHVFNDCRVVEALLKTFANDKVLISSSAGESLLCISADAFGKFEAFLVDNLTQKPPKSGDDAAIMHWNELRYKCADFLGRIGLSKYTRLLKPLLYEDFDFGTIAEAMYAINTDESIEILTAELYRRVKGPIENYRIISVYYMGKIARYEFVPVLLSLIDDENPDVHRLAVFGLKKILAAHVSG